jgi:transcriptional regulator with XRE-family HTH domain
MSELSEVLREELREREYREGYDEGFLDHWIATQVRVVREQRGMTQAELGKAAGMKQSRISAIEDEDYGSWSVTTLQRIAHALGVRLRVELAEWSTLLQDVGRASRADMERRRFEDDPVFAKFEAEPEMISPLPVRPLSYQLVEMNASQKPRAARQQYRYKAINGESQWPSVGTKSLPSLNRKVLTSSKSRFLTSTAM